MLLKQKLSGEEAFEMKFGEFLNEHLTRLTEPTSLNEQIKSFSFIFIFSTKLPLSSFGHTTTPVFSPKFGFESGSEQKGLARAEQRGLASMLVWEARSEYMRAWVLGENVSLGKKRRGGLLIEKRGNFEKKSTLTSKIPLFSH